MTKLTDEIVQASSNKQRVCGLPSTVQSYYCNHIANTNQNLPAKYPTPRLLHMYATCAQPPAFGRARTDLNFCQGQTSLKNLSAKLESFIGAEYERLECSARAPLGVHAR